MAYREEDESDLASWAVISEASETEWYAVEEVEAVTGLIQVDNGLEKEV